MLEKKSLSLKVKANCLHSQRYWSGFVLYGNNDVMRTKYEAIQYKRRRKNLERLVRFEFVSVVAEVFNVSLFYVH